jgi:hypothetical protein
MVPVKHFFLIFNEKRVSCAEWVLGVGVAARAAPREK